MIAIIFITLTKKKKISIFFCWNYANTFKWQSIQLNSVKFWNCSETALKLLWNCSETFLKLKLLWNCSENALKLILLWNCSETALKFLNGSILTVKTNISTNYDWESKKCCQTKILNEFKCNWCHAPILEDFLGDIVEQTCVLADNDREEIVFNGHWLSLSLSLSLFRCLANSPISYNSIPLKIQGSMRSAITAITTIFSPFSNVFID